MNTCIQCHKNPVHIKKRGLCRKCYQKFKRDNKKPPTTQQTINFIYNLTKKYGSRIFRDFEKVRDNPYYKLQDVAAKYGFTRERSRQLYNQIHAEGYTKRIKIKRQMRKELNTTVCLNHPKRKAADYKKGTKHLNAAIAAKKFMERCEALKFNIEIPCDKKCDIIINDYNIGVYSAIVPFLPTGANIPYYRSVVRQHQLKVCDFFAVYIHSKDFFYIIPNLEKGTKIKKVKNFYILSKKSNHHCALNKYHEYKNRFDLLDKPHT